MAIKNTLLGGASEFVPGVSTTFSTDLNDTFDAAVNGTLNMALVASGTLGSANATISASVPSGFRLLRVEFLGFTTGDPGATAIKMRINAATTNYLGRAYTSTTTTIANVTNTDSFPVSGASMFGGAGTLQVSASIACPASAAKYVTGTLFGLEAGSPTYHSGTFGGRYNDSAELTEVSFVLSSSTWTTASVVRVYGTK